MNKRCRSCYQVKPIEDFSVKSSSYDGRSARCKSCASAARKARRAANPTPAKYRAPKATTPKVIARSVAVSGLTTAASDYRPSKELVATWAAVLLSAADGNPADNLLFTGPSGCGKTEAGRYLAGLSGLPWFKIDAPSMVDPESWFGTREVVVEDGAPKTVYQPSVFVTALEQRCVLIIDEANRVADAIRNILLSVLDDSRSVTNPLTGQTVVRHPECFIIMTGNTGLMFTGTYAVDPAFLTRSLTTNFDYLETNDEIEVAMSRTGVERKDAELFVRFANEARSRARTNEDFPPISTREVITACRLVARGLDANTAARQTVVNAASGEGGGESVRAQLEMIWTGIRSRDQQTSTETEEAEA